MYHGGQMSQIIILVFYLNKKKSWNLENYWSVNYKLFIYFLGENPKILKSIGDQHLLNKFPPKSP